MNLQTSAFFLVEALDSVLRWLHDDVGLGWGIGIIVLTVIVRILLIPLTYKQITSMMHMQQYQPMIKEINEKYKDDPQRKQQELMKFFKEHEINPLASCLPLLLQLPFFICMFYALRDRGLQNEIESTNPQFLFIDNLVDKPTGTTLVLLLILYVGSQLGSTVVSMSTATDANQKRIMLALPFILVPFVVTFPSGLLVYWITTNFWTFGQSFVVKHLRTKNAEQLETGVVADGTGTVDASAGSAVDKKAPPPPPRQRKKRTGKRR